MTETITTERPARVPPAPAPPRSRRRPLLWLVQWFDSWATQPAAPDSAASAADEAEHAATRRINWGRVVPFLLLHAACVLVFVVGWSWTAVLVAAGLYFVRMFAITAGYHRYFAHRAFRTSRVGQFLFALLGATAVQRGPLWWAAHHRAHHEFSDTEADAHSPRQQGFLWSHVGWVLSRAHFRTKLERVKDLARFPELRFLDRFDTLVPILFAVAVFLSGLALERWAPQLGVTGWQLLVWGFVVSTVVLYHATFTINSLSHVFGRRRFETRDTSRNNALLAAITLGEGWHNNHHHYPASARQGFYWWEIDVSYYVLRALSFLGVVWDLRPVPARVLTRRRAR